MSSNTTRDTIEYIRYIRENKDYIEIGIKKYKKFDVSITNINNLLGLNILSASLIELEKQLEELHGINYIDAVEKISILGENLSAIISEEKDPMLPKLNKAFEEER